MSEILFVTATDSLQIRQETNGTMLLATKLLQAGFDVDMLRFCQIPGYGRKYSEFAENLVAEILRRAPQCVSFYTLWPFYHVILRVARDVRAQNKDITIILGGPQASATAMDTMEAMEFVDYICTGEGENTIVPFCEALLRNGSKGLETVPGLYYRQDGQIHFNDIPCPLCDLNTLPRWDPRLMDVAYEETEADRRSATYFMPIDAGRGCPYSCTFCCSSYFWKRTYRLKSPARIVADIRYFKETFGIRSFWFSHDAFTTNKQLVTEVCDRIIAEGLNVVWRCTARIDCISEDLILKMKQAGMTQIELGVETGSKRMQKLINKNLNLDRACQMIDFLLKEGIRVGLFFMYGFPEETEEDLAQTLDMLYAQLDKGNCHVSMSFCRFNPTTALTEQYLDKLVIDPKIQCLYRTIFGYKEEADIIAANRSIFPFVYHLPTALRDEFQYLYLLVFAYQRLPRSVRYVRQLYKGDNIQFFRDFYYNNIDAFSGNLTQIVTYVYDNLVDMLMNAIKDFDIPYRQQLRELMRFDYNVYQVLTTAEDITIQDTYGFSYIDFRLHRPIEQYMVGESEILLRRVNGKLDLQVLRLQ